MTTSSPSTLYSPLWPALLGNSPSASDSLQSLADSCLQSPDFTQDWGDLVLFEKSSGSGFGLQAVAERSEGSDELTLSRLSPLLPMDYFSLNDAMPFRIERVREREKGWEAALSGTLFGREFSFFCQNYPRFRDERLEGRQSEIRVSLVAFTAEAMFQNAGRVEVRVGGPRARSVSAPRSRFLSPLSESTPEVCEFYFPIDDCAEVEFFGRQGIRLENFLQDGQGKRFYHQVYLSSAVFPELRRFLSGDPIQGTGWVQGEIVRLLS